MSDGHQDDDVRYPKRDETETERLDRNWTSLLQELRVAQTGVQLLTGFLLVLPFQQRFDKLDAEMHTVYLVTFACSIGATVLLIAPVGMHRLLFRHHQLDDLVSGSHVLAIIGLLMLGLTLAGSAIVIFDAVMGSRAAWIAGGCTLGALIVFWVVVPMWQRLRSD